MTPNKEMRPRAYAPEMAKHMLYVALDSAHIGVQCPYLMVFETTYHTIWLFQTKKFGSPLAGSRYFALGLYEEEGWEADIIMRWCGFMKLGLGYGWGVNV